MPTRARRPLKHWAALAATVVLGCAPASPVVQGNGVQPDLPGGVAPGAVAASSPLTGAVHDPGPDVGDTLALEAPAIPIGAPGNISMTTTGGGGGSAPGLPAPSRAPFVAPAPPNVRCYDARLLVIAARRDEVELTALASALDAQGTPYDLWIVSEHPGGLGADQLASGLHGFYQGIVLATSEPAIPDADGWRAAMADNERAALAAYEKDFGVRQVTWYTWPTADYGFGPATVLDTAKTPLSVHLTAAGAKIFSGLRPDAVLSVRDAYTYLAAQDGDTDTLMADDSNHALVAMHRYVDGRENLALTFDSNPSLNATRALAPGVVTWLTRGAYVGGVTPYMNVQIDDLFLDTRQRSGQYVRATPADLDALAAWVASKRKDPVAAGLMLSWGFNGVGATPGDPLSAAASAHAADFWWIDHTYSHANLDGADATTTRQELANNDTVATRLGLEGYDPGLLITGGASGLSNPAAVGAMAARGVRLVVTDASVSGQGNPAPDEGLRNAIAPTLLMVPRRPTNMFFNVATPDDWVSAYNARYQGYWGHAMDYNGLLDKESDVLLGYMLRGDVDPWMFGQANVHLYDGQHSLLSDLLDRVIAKYEAISSVPFKSLSLADVGKAMRARMTLDAATVVGRVVPGTSLLLTASDDVQVPVGAQGTVSLTADQTSTLQLGGP